MTRLFPNPWLGQHPLLPDRPPPLSANGWIGGIGNGGLVGLVIGVARWPFGLSAAFTVKAAAYSSVVFTAAGASWEFLDNWATRRMLAGTQGIKVKPKRRVLFERVGFLDCDDFILGGAVIGCLYALSRPSFPGITGWRRYLGISSLGACMGETSYVLYNRDKVLQASSVRNQHRAERLGILAHLRLERDKRLGNDSKHEVARQRPNISWPFSFGQVEPETNEGDMDVEEPEAGSIGKPHIAVRNEDGSFEFLPHTDYRWSPSSREDAKATLEEHLRELMAKRDQLSKTAEYLWMALIGKEKSFYLSENPEEKDEQKETLAWLGSMHFTVWIELARTSWMIGDSTKRLQQILEGVPSMRTEADRQERLLNAKEHLDRLQSQSASALWRDQGQRIESAESTLAWLRDEEHSTLHMLTSLQQRKARFLRQAKSAPAHTNGRKGRNQAPKLEELEKAFETAEERRLKGQVDVLRQMIKEVEEDLIQLKTESNNV